MKQISALELNQKLDNNEPFQLIDIREPYERTICSIGGDLIPMEQVLTSLDKIKTTIPVVFYCRTGARAKAIVDTIERIHQHTNLYFLNGGIIAYAQEIDNSLEQY